MSALDPILILCCGGTIDKRYGLRDHLEVAAPFVGEALRQGRCRHPIEIRSLLRLDSLQMGDPERLMLAAAVRETHQKRILITHGTATMHLSASAMADIPDKTIVFTGSFVPGRCADSDAHFNLGGALVAAALLPPGIHVVINGRLYDARRLVKDPIGACFHERP